MTSATSDTDSPSLTNYWYIYCDTTFHNVNGYYIGHGSAWYMDEDATTGHVGTLNTPMP